MNEERKQAWRTSHRWLDQRMNSLVEMVPGDPDYDACVLARQYLRALDKISQLKSIIAAVSPSQLPGIAMGALADEWPE